jgi:hypothetical protein
MNRWILYWNNWTLSIDSNKSVDILKESFEDFSFENVFFYAFQSDQTGSISKLWKEILTEFSIDKKSSTFRVPPSVVEQIIFDAR